MLLCCLFAFGFNLSEQNKSTDNITIENDLKVEMTDDLNNDKCKASGGILCPDDEYFCLFYQNEFKQNEYGKVFYKWKCADGHVYWLKSSTR